VTLAAGTRLGGYEIRAPLGAGGMGEIYRAHDAKLNRDVAIKVLPESLASDPDALARFEREALAVAALSHPNILAIHAFGEQDGIVYAVMELLEGETLREKLQAGPIPEKRGLSYTLQIARGLIAAHDKGIVHRDLKPENVFVTGDDHVKILDFGIAKKAEAVPEDDGLTKPGSVVGTLGYSSPEQLRGLAVDHRSDIFSLGAILYEILAGQRPFKRDMAIETMAAILQDAPAPLSESGRKIPPALERVVLHCLEKKPEKRFQSARDVAFALEEAAIWTTTAEAQAAPPAARNRLVPMAVLAVLLLVVAGLWILARRPHPGAAGAARRVAVLPFENQGSPEDDYFADGMSDEVRAKLTTVPGLQVIARGSSIPYKRTTKTPKQIAQELDAAYLLTATVRWEKGGGTSRVHVTPELVEVSGTGAPASKWQQPFDAALTDVFQVQSEIAAKVSQALGVVLAVKEETRLSERPTENLAAYDAYLKGEEASGGMSATSPASLHKALGFYDEAVRLDPNFVPALARVSMVNTMLFYLTAQSPELVKRAMESAYKAISIAPNRREGYVALGNYQQFVVQDFQRALQEYEKGQRVAAPNAELLAWIARSEESLGRWDSALGHYQQAERLDPRSAVTVRRLAEALLWLRRYREAREILDRGLAFAPANFDLIEDEVVTYLGDGDLAGARAVVAAERRDVDPSALAVFLATYWDLAWVLDEKQRDLLLKLPPDAFGSGGSMGLHLAEASAFNGEPAAARRHAEEARKTFEEQLREAPEDGQRHILLGLALAYLGRKEEAIREGLRGAALVPVSKDAHQGPYFQHQLVRIYALVGEPEKALDLLEPLLKMPYFLSAAWLKIDPNFDPLRKNPRFQKLVGGVK
jgi:TolB-like protein/tetratricopeptide (TPR) repeat protein